MTKTVKLVNLWMEDPEHHHDKVYRLELQQQGDLYDVFATYGRRGAPPRIHIWGEKLPAHKAFTIWHRKLDEKMKHGYLPVQEDVSTGVKKLTRKEWGY